MGVIGNVLVLIVILTSKSMRSSTNLFLLSLSIADLLVLVVCCPNAMVEMYMRRVRQIVVATQDGGTMPRRRKLDGCSQEIRFDSTATQERMKQSTTIPRASDFALNPKYDLQQWELLLAQAPVLSVWPHLFMMRTLRLFCCLLFS